MLAVAREHHGQLADMGVEIVHEGHALARNYSA
jgi:hypothetical protein